MRTATHDGTRLVLAVEKGGAVAGVGSVHRSQSSGDKVGGNRERSELFCHSNNKEANHIGVPPRQRRASLHSSATATSSSVFAPFNCCFSKFACAIFFWFVFTHAQLVSKY